MTRFGSTCRRRNLHPALVLLFCGFMVACGGEREPGADMGPHALLYVAEEGGHLEGEASQSVEHGADASPVTAVPDQGHVFVQWSDGLTTLARHDENVVEDATFTATFEKVPENHTLTYLAGENGALEGEPIQTVEHGADATPVTAVPDQGHVFKEWSDGVSTGTRHDENVTADATVTASFTPMTFTLTYLAGENGSVAGETSQVIEYGHDGSAVEAVPNAGHHFVEWSDGVASAWRTDENVTADSEVTARFEVSSYSIGGRVSGIADGRSVVVHLDGEHELILNSDDEEYAFEALLSHQASYSVTIIEQPRQHDCTVANASGTVHASAVVDVDVVCVSFPLIAAGASFAVAIRADGTLWAWGDNDCGALGIGDIDLEYSATPMQIGADSDWVRVSAGESHALAVKEDGSLWAWGLNGRAQLGLDDTRERHEPTIVGDDRDWLAVSTLLSHSLALKTDGTLWAWGHNRQGRLGVGDADDRAVPTLVGTDDDWVAIAAGEAHSLALKEDGSLWAWGSNAKGQLGLGETDAVSSPSRVGAALWRRVVAGRYHSLAVRADGTLWAWGANYDGELGLGEVGRVSEPTQVGEGADWIDLSANEDISFGLREGGTLWSWGANDYGRLGLGDTEASNEPARVGADASWRHVVAGARMSFAVGADGALWAWGSNDEGQLGVGVSASVAEPALVDDSSGWRSVTTGDTFSLALQDDGSLWVSGGNGHGQLGLGDTHDRHELTRMGTDDDWVTVSAGGAHVLAVKSDGCLWAWGSNYSRALGLGQEVPNQLEPQRVGEECDWSAVTAGATYSLALKTDGSLWAWGDNSYGQLGIPGAPAVPERVGEDNDWVVVRAGSDSEHACGRHTLGLKADGTLWGWGDNRWGQLGMEGTVRSPRQIGSDDDWTEVFAGSRHSAALKEDGSAWFWGRNGSGQLGLGDDDDRFVPVQAGSETSWSWLATGREHSLLLTLDGTLWATGSNSIGQLGLGDIEARRSPEQVGAAGAWRLMSAATDHALAIRKDGSLWGWGDNDTGQLGFPTSIFSTPRPGPEI